MNKIMDCQDCNPPPPTFVQNLRERLATVVKLLIEKVLGGQKDGSGRLNENCRAPCCPCGRSITKEDILDQLIQLTRLCEASNVEQESPCITRDKPELKRKRPHESISEHDVSLQHTSKDRRHDSSASEDVQKIGTHENITVSDCDCRSESMSVNEEVLKKMSYTDMVPSSLEISGVESKNKNGTQSKTDASSEVWMQNHDRSLHSEEWPWQNTSLENLLRDTIKARVNSIVNIAANKFVCFKHSNKLPLNDDNICNCHLESDQNLKLETLELAINATDELRNEMKYHTTDDNIVQQIPENKTDLDSNIQQVLADIIKIDILELISDVVHTLRVKTISFTEISGRQNFDQGNEFGNLGLNESHTTTSDDNVSETFSNIIQKIDYGDVSTILPHSIEEILMENILEIVKSTKIKMNSFVENVNDSDSSPQKIECVTSQEMFNQIIDNIIHAATQLKEQELFPEKQIDVDVQSQSNSGQQHIEEGIKQSVSKLISFTSDKFIQKSIIGTSEEDVDFSINNWYPPDSVEKEVRIQTLNAVISAAEKLKLNTPDNNTIAIRHSMMEIILHCVSNMKRLLAVVNLITETLNDLKIEAQKNKIRSSEGSGMSQEKVSEKSFDDFKKHRICMCSCCKSLFPLLHKKRPHNQMEPLDVFERYVCKKTIQTTEPNLVQEPHSEICDNEFNQESVINRRYTTGLIEEIIKQHTEKVSSDSYFHPSSEFGSCKKICSVCQCESSSLAGEDKFDHVPVISRRYTENLIDEIIHNHIQKRETSLGDAVEFEQEPVIRRFTQQLLEEIIQGNIKEVASDTVSSPVSQSKKTSQTTRDDNPCNNSCSDCQCQIPPKKSSLIRKDAFEQIPVIYKSTEDPKEGEIQDHIQERNTNLTDSNRELEDDTDINRYSKEGPEDTEDHSPANNDDLEDVSVINRHYTLEIIDEIMRDHMQDSNRELEEDTDINRYFKEGPEDTEDHSPANNGDLEDVPVINRHYTLEIIDEIVRDHMQDSNRELEEDTDINRYSKEGPEDTEDHSPANNDDFEDVSVINRHYTSEIIDEIMRDHMQDISSDMSFQPNFNSSETNIPLEAGVHCNRTCSDCRCQNPANISSILPSEELEQESVINRRFTKELIEEIIKDHTIDVSSYSSFHPPSKSSDSRISIGAGDNASSNIFMQQPSLEETIKNEIITRLINILNMTANTLEKIPQFSDGYLKLADKQNTQMQTLDFVINVTNELKNDIKDKKNETKCAIENVSCNCKEKKFVDRIKLDILGMVTDIVNSLKTKVEKSHKNINENLSQSFGSIIRNLDFEDAPSVMPRPEEEIIMEKILDIVKSIKKLDSFAEFIYDSGSSSQRSKSISSQETFSQIIDIIINIANQFKKELLLEHSTQEPPTSKSSPLQETTKLEQEPIIDAIKQRVSHLIVSIANIEEILQGVITKSEDAEQDTSVPFNDWPSALRHSIEVVAYLEAINAIINAAEKLKNQSVCKSKSICSSMQKTIVDDADEMKMLGVLNYVSDVLNDVKEEESQKNGEKSPQVQESVFKKSIENSKNLQTCMCTRCKSNYPFHCKKGMQNHVASLKNSKNICTARNNKPEHLAKEKGSHGEMFGDKTDQPHKVSCGKSKCSKSKSKHLQSEESNFNMITDENESVHIDDLNNSHSNIEERKVTNTQAQEENCLPCSASKRAEHSMFQVSFYCPSQSLNESDAEMNVYEKSSLHPPPHIPCVKSTCPLLKKKSFHQSQPFEGIVNDEVVKDTSDLTMDILNLNQKPSTSDQRCQQPCAKHSIAKSIDSKTETSETQKESLFQIKSDDGEEKNCKEYCDKLKWYIHKLAKLSKQELSKQKTTKSADKVKEKRKCCTLQPEEESDTNSETISSVTEAFLDKLLTICSKCEFPIEKLNNVLHKIAKAVEHTSNEDFQKLFHEISADKFNKDEEKVVQNTIQPNKTSFLGQHFENKPNKTIPTDDVKNICDNICEWKMDTSTDITSNKKELNVVDVIPLKFTEDQITQTRPSNNENERKTPVCPSFMKEMTQEQLRLQLDIWFKDLKDAHQMFIRQSNFVIKTDFLLANNREKLEYLSHGIAKCSNNLDFIEKSLRECDELHCECLSVHSMYLNTDFKEKGERGTMYTNLLRVKQSLNETSKQKDMINEFIKEKLDNSYVTRITRILNCYANTLQGVEYKIQVLENELQTIKNLSSAVLSKRHPL